MRSVKMQPSSLKASFALGIYLVAVINATAADDSVAAFYRGRTVQAIVGYTPGSTFEFYLRAFVPHFSRHVPGNPTIIIQHMPGAGSLKATLPGERGSQGWIGLRYNQSGQHHRAAA